MAIHVLNSMGKLASRFVHELLPVALASVIGTLVVNHYARQPASPSVVFQAQPSASENAIAQSLREEHELIASFVKLTQDKTNDKHSESVGSEVASVATLPSFARRSAHPRAATCGGAESGRANSRQKLRSEKGSATTEAPPSELDLAKVAPDSPPMLASPPPAAQLAFEPRARPIIRLAGAVRGWAADVAQAPGRVAFAPRWPDWPSAPSVIRPLAFFRQN